MKGIKKSLLLAMAMCFSFGLAACGGGKEDNNDNSNPVESSSSIGGDTSEDGNGNGSESDSDVKLPDISVEVPDVEDIDGAPVANADEWNTIFHNSLSATNATIVTTASEKGTVMESGITMIANGVVYDKWDNKDGTSSYNFFGEVDGQSYHWKSEDGKTWTYEEIDWTPADYASVAYELEGMDEMLTFAGSTWNAETGMYTGDCNIGAYSLKISDGKIVYIAISADSGMMAGVDCVYQIVYGQTAAIQLPKLPSADLPASPDVPEIPDVDGEELKDEATWKAAWDNTNKATNFVAVMTENYNGEEDVMILTAADGKSYMYGEYADGEREYIYYGEVDGKVYSWHSEDGKTWEVEEVYIDIAMVTTPAGFIRGIDQLVNFSDVTYEKGYYLFSYNGFNFRVKFAGGYVVEFVFVDSDGEEQSYKLAYGNATVGELPPLPQIIGEEVKDATEWANALENSMAQNNFICTVKGRSERDGKVTVHTEYTAVDNGKVYMESQTVMHSGNGNTALSVPQRTYQGYVNGIAYEWIGTGDSWSVRIIDVVETSSPVEYVDLADWDFAMAKFDQETGVYAFETDGQSLKVKVVDGLVAYIELNAGGFFLEFTITYGNANVVLPSLDGSGGSSGGNTDNPNNPVVKPDVEVKLPELIFDLNVGQGIVGEQVSAEIFKKAITEALDSTNFTIQGKSYIEGVSTLIAANIVDGKHYSTTKAAVPTEDGGYEESTIHMIASTVDGTDWAWMSFDGKYWDNGPAEGVVMGGWKDGKDIFGRYLQVFLSMDSQFNAQTGEYYISADGVTVAIKIVDGEVKTVYMSPAEGQYMLYVITYDNAVDFNLPPVTNGGSGGMTGEMPSEKEWDYAFKELLQSENLSVKTVSEIEYTYGTRIWESAQYQYDGNAIEYSLDKKSNDGSDDNRQRIVLANENGEDTQYIYSYDTSIWTKEDSVLFSAAEFWRMQTYSWERFADIYEQMQWDGNYFYLEAFTYVSGDGYKYVFYDVRINISNGQVIEISYRTEEMDYSMQTAVFFYDYDQTSVAIPVDGQGDIGGDVGGDVSGDMGNVTNPDVGVDKEENMDNNEQLNPTYPTNSDNGETGETDNGEETPENDKVIIINNQYGY